MADAFVQVQPDGGGKRVQTFEVTVAGQLVEAQAVVPVDPASGAAIAPALDATLTSGAQKAIARGGAKGATVAADTTSTASGANHQGGDVCLYDGAGNLIDPRVIRALTSADVVSALQSGAWTVGVNNFPATQPVSLAVAPTTPVTGTFFQATQPVSLASAPTTPVTAPTLTKGTQSANGFSVQDLKDSGRVNILWTAEFSPSGTSEALLTITESRDGAATSTFSSKVVTSGKRLRITSISMQVENTLGSSIQRAYLRLRFNTAGAATTSSPQQTTMAVQAAGTVKSIGSGFDDFPDGIEFLGDGTKQIGFSLTAPDWVSATSTLKVYVSVFGYEY